MKHWVACLLLIVASLALPLALQAQADNARLDDSAFWSLVATTRADVRNALAQRPLLVDPALVARWQQLRTVHSGGADVSVDTAWVVEALSSADAPTLTVLQDRLDALLTDYVRRVRAGDSGLSADALDSVLQDPRFNYAETTPTPVAGRTPPPSNPRPSQGPAGMELSQVLLTVAGVALALGFVIFFARRLSVNPTELPTGAEPSAEPVTSTEAVDVSTGFAAQRDYRSAIRYLYLSSLLALDERGLIHYDSALTNREHLRQVRERPQLYERLRAVVNVFEGVWYGYQVVDEASYLEFRQRIGELQRMVL